MIAVKHTPVRPIPRQQLSAETLAGATMAVNVDAAALTPEQKEILRTFTRGGGTLLTGPPGWKDPTVAAGSITLEKAELERLNDIWRDVKSMIGRRNMGVRLFNVSSMLSNFLAAPDGNAGHRTPGELFGLSGGEGRHALPGRVQTRHADHARKAPTNRWKCTRPKKDGGWTSIASASAPLSDWCNSMTRREWIAMIRAAPSLRVLHGRRNAPVAPVAIAKCASYDDDVTAKMAAMFDQLGGLEKLVRGKTVTVKLNLTGSPGQRFQGKPLGVTHYTHPKWWAPPRT